MAQAVIWSQEALDDIDSIAEYVSRDSIYHAQQVVEKVFDLGDSLTEQPKSGRKVPELNDSHVREHFIYSYRLIYEIKDRRTLYSGCDSWQTSTGICRAIYLI